MSWLELPGDFSPFHLAEFIEGEALFSEDDYFSISELRSIFTSGLQPNDEEFSFAFAEIERRSREFGSHYPFLADERGVVVDRSEGSILYSFLTLLSLKGTPMRTDRSFPRSDRLFDSVIREVLLAYGGPGTQVAVFAYPPRDGRPERFVDAVEWLAEKLGSSLTGFAIPDHYADGGVDLVMWRPFPDAKPGFQIIMVQNTVQLTFSRKPRDIVRSRWPKWISIGAEPTVGFAIPFAIEDGDIWWEDVTEVAQLAFDRGRIMHQLSSINPTAWPEWRDIASFVGDEVAEARERGSFAPDPLMAQQPVRRKKK